MSDLERAPMTVQPLGGERYLVSDGSRRTVAFGVRSAAATWVFLDGQAHVVPTGGARGRGARTDQDGALSAPMPATVVRIDVAPGQDVKKGETLVVLEAMKMELPLRAPRDGLVKAVRCQPGELVQPGIPLVEME